MFDPGKRLLGRRLNVFRRMHRKIVVVDGEVAFIGGINFSADHLGDFGPAAKQDYALQVEGPVVRDIHHFAPSQIAPNKPPQHRWWRRRVRQQTPGYGRISRGEARALFVVRDNDQHRNDIEEHYLQAIRDARSRLLIANAYFFPDTAYCGNPQCRATRCTGAADPPGRAGHAHRQFGARMLYNYLMRDGVEIHEYCRRPLHGKVALADYEWSTVGSSNLDPLSLSLNLEANLIIRDHVFNRHLHERLDHLLQTDCRRIPLNGSSAASGGAHRWRF